MFQCVLHDAQAGGFPAGSLLNLPLRCEPSGHAAPCSNALQADTAAILLGQAAPVNADKSLRMHQQGSATAVGQDFTQHLSGPPLMAIPRTGTAPFGGMSGAGLTSLYGKLRTAAVTMQPAAADAVAAGSIDAKKEQCFSTASWTSSSGLQPQNTAGLPDCNRDAGCSTSQVHKGATSCNSVPFQYSLFSNSSYPSSHNSSRTSSSHSTISSLTHTTMTPAVLAGELTGFGRTGPPGTGQELLAALGLSCADPGTSLGSQQVMLSTPPPHCGLGTPTPAEHTIHTAAAQRLLQPTIARDEHWAVDNLLHILTQQHMQSSNSNSTVRDARLLSGHLELLQQQLLMQQLTALQAGHISSMHDSSISPDPLELVTATSNAFVGGAGPFDLQSLLTVPYPAAPSGQCSANGPPILHMRHTAAQPLPGLTGSAAQAGALAAQDLHVSQLNLGSAQSPSEHLAQLLAQLDVGNSAAGRSSASGSTMSRSNGNSPLGLPAGPSGPDSGATGVSVALAALKHKLVLGSAGVNTASGSAGAGLGSVAELPGAVAALPGAQEAAPGKQGVGPGSNPLYKTELCRTWLETGGCRYGSRCQFAHGPHELRPIHRHPKYKTQVCRTYVLHGSCPYGDRCNFIHDQHLQAHGNEGVSSSSSGAGSFMEPAHSQG